MTKSALTVLLCMFGAAMTALVIFSCSVEQPSVGEDDQDPEIKHANYSENACTECHEVDRPIPGHGKGSDCQVCHESFDDKAKAFTPKAGITSSGDPGTATSTASDTDTGTEAGDPTKVHEHPAGLTSCVACHEKDRAPPPHVATGDCVTCHEPSNTGGKWKPK